MNIAETKAIKCKLEDIPATHTRKAFIREFMMLAPATYYNNNSLQEPEGKDRSFSDLWSLVKSRFPKTSFNALVRIIAELNQEKLCDVVWCAQNNKFMVRNQKTLTRKKISLNPLPFITSHSKKYFENKEGVDGVSYKELMKIKEKELKN